MLVNLTDVFTNEGQVQELTVSYEADRFTNQFGTFLIKEKSPVALKLSNIGHAKALVHGNVHVTFVLACDRCLKDVDYTFDLSFNNEVVSPDYTGDDTDEDDSLEIMEGYHLNVDELVNNELLLEWPMKILCKDDCKGICKICGKNLNDGDCGCDDFVPDPRMAAIKDLFHANKEV
ncbi:MAG: DUF177 domain-containing protein [Lachnospiraceae bacterium]|nr:DUF177 domain-containing protein [Lachnospiraceae bacterium]